MILGNAFMNKSVYTNLESFINLEEFDHLHYKICLGFAKSRHLSRIGNLEVNTKNILPNNGYRHLCQVYQDYKEFSEDSEIKKISNGLDETDLSVFLKFAMGGYDSYQTYYIEPLNEYFPEVYKWIINFKTIGIFSSISESYFLTLDAGGIPFEHYHPDNGRIAEFIHIRPKIVRPFYVRDNKTLEKIYIDARAAWWDDRLIHGGGAISMPSYSLRIDGVFTDEFRQKIANG